MCCPAALHAEIPGFLNEIPDTVEVFSACYLAEMFLIITVFSPFAAFFIFFSQLKTSSHIHALPVQFRFTY
jgi:hypothetical protein